MYNFLFSVIIWINSLETFNVIVIGTRPQWIKVTDSMQFKSDYGIGVFCYSRTNQQPSPVDNCAQGTKPEETVEIVLNQPCSPSATSENCSPIYISVSSLGLLDNLPCFGKKNFFKSKAILSLTSIFCLLFNYWLMERLSIWFH